MSEQIKLCKDLQLDIQPTVCCSQFVLLVPGAWCRVLTDLAYVQDNLHMYLLLNIKTEEQNTYIFSRTNEHSPVDF